MTAAPAPRVGTLARFSWALFDWATVANIGDDLDGMMKKPDGILAARKIDRGLAADRGVDLGEEAGSRVLVRAGLEEGDRIVAAPPNNLVDGERVIVDAT